MDPTNAERAAMTDLEKVLTWAGFDGPKAEDADSTEKSLLDLFGVKKSTPPRILGIHPEADTTTVLRGWKIPGTPAARLPTMSEVGMAKLFLRACCVVAGSGETLETLRTRATAFAAAAAAPVASVPQGRRIKLSSVVSQIDDTEILVESEGDPQVLCEV